ncbi:hypothetical protein DITRI_Ditri14bG0055700 [Diplodiscus trichospermus]
MIRRVRICDVEVGHTLSKNFKQVQAVLDQNRQLIQKVNENYQSKVPDNLVKNVGLIQEINGNISKVLDIYAYLSVSRTPFVNERGSGTGSCGNFLVCVKSTCRGMNMRYISALITDLVHCTAPSSANTYV